MASHHPQALTPAARGSGVGSFRSLRFRKERCTVHLIQLLFRTRFT